MRPYKTKKFLYSKEYHHDGKEEEWGKSLQDILLAEDFYLEYIKHLKTEHQENNPSINGTWNKTEFSEEKMQITIKMFSILNHQENAK